MDIMELGAIGELVGGIAVIASLIYVGVQVRHSAASTRLASSTAVSDGFNPAMESILQGDTPAIMRRAVTVGIGEMTEEDRFRFAGTMFVMYSHLEAVYYQVKGGHSEGYVGPRVRYLVSWFQNTPGVREWWYGNLYDDRPGEIRHAFSTEFREYVASLEVANPSLSGDEN